MLPPAPEFRARKSAAPLKRDAQDRPRVEQRHLRGLPLFRWRLPLAFHKKLLVDRAQARTSRTSSILSITLEFDSFDLSRGFGQSRQNVLDSSSRTFSLSGYQHQRLVEIRSTFAHARSAEEQRLVGRFFGCALFGGGAAAIARCAIGGSRAR